MFENNYISPMKKKGTHEVLYIKLYAFRVSVLMFFLSDSNRKSKTQKIKWPELFLIHCRSIVITFFWMVIRVVVHFCSLINLTILDQYFLNLFFSFGWRFNVKALLENTDYILSFPNVHNSVYKGPVLFIGGGKSDHIQ